MAAFVTTLVVIHFRSDWRFVRAGQDARSVARRSETFSCRVVELFASRPPKFRRAGYAALVLLAIFVAEQYLHSETLTERAYRICEACGLESDKIDRQIENKSRSTLSRAEEIELYHSTGKPRDALAPCVPYVHAVVNARGSEKNDKRTRERPGPVDPLLWTGST